MQYENSARECDELAEHIERHDPKIAGLLRAAAGELRAVDEILARPS